MSAGIHCPDCASADTFVVDVRASVMGARRRRRCNSCNGTFTTIEMLATTRGRAALPTVLADGIDDALEPVRHAANELMRRLDLVMEMANEEDDYG